MTNESGRTRASLHAKLTRLGFELELEDILTPAMAMMLIIKEKKQYIQQRLEDERDCNE